jgi:D-threo-aldose 1-dehydrogenase
MRSAEEARHNLESFEVEVPAQVWTDLRGEGLISATAVATA